MSRAEQRIPVLDGWRVLLVFLVSWYHIWQQSWLTPRIGTVSLDFLLRTGYMPVDGTVLLSGFLLFLPYANAMAQGGRIPSTRKFYQRRIARIVPSYLFFTLLMLFAVALPQQKYSTAAAMWEDLLAHFSFTFVWFPKTYLQTPLGAASWTLCIEVQMYVLFPMIARLTMKRPAATLTSLALIAAYFRMWAMWRYAEYGMVVNQLISFLDVYAIGMALAIMYPRLRQWTDGLNRQWIAEAAATVLFALAIWGIIILLKEQARSATYAQIQSGQMLRRMPFALLLGICMITLPFALAPLRWLFGNPVMHFFSGISMNYYLIHQPLAVWLKEHRIPDSPFDTPNMAGDTAWMFGYTWRCFGYSLLLAVLLTYLVEKPAAWALKRLFTRLDQRRQGLQPAAHHAGTTQT